MIFRFFNRTSVSRDRDCYGLTKISEILGGRPRLDHFEQAGTNRPVQYGRESAHKSRAQGVPSSLGVYMDAIKHISKEENETIRGASEKSAAADSAEPNSKAILQRIPLLLLRQHWRAPSFSCAPTFL